MPLRQEEFMNAKLAILVILMPSAAAFAQTDLSTSAGRNDDYGRSSAHVAARNDYEGAGPFTREEARRLSAVWSTIRGAENFHDINWRSVGLARAPGDRDARRFMAEDWGSLRRAERFDDIDWRAEYHRR
jgi:hypothetical protein